jgi:transcriptional regulator with XRE-family HTH domain
MTNDDVGSELRALREARKLRRPQVQAATGIPAGRISRIETGTQPKPDEVAKLRAFYTEGATASPAMDASTKDAAQEKPKPAGVAAPTRSPGRANPKRFPPGRLPLAEQLHFTDGAVVDPTNCPRSINARSHWVWDPEARVAACNCIISNDIPEDESEPEEDEELESASA